MTKAATTSQIRKFAGRLYNRPFADDGVLGSIPDGKLHLVRERTMMRGGRVRCEILLTGAPAGRGELSLDLTINEFNGLASETDL